jgi:hypothetical protein
MWKFLTAMALCLVFMLVVAVAADNEATLSGVVRADAPVFRVSWENAAISYKCESHEGCTINGMMIDGKPTAGVVSKMKFGETQSVARSSPPPVTMLIKTPQGPLEYEFGGQ